MILLSLPVISTLGQGAPAGPVPLAVPPQPRLDLSTNRIDFGDIYLGLSADRMLTIANIGDALLQVTAILTNDSAFTILLMSTNQMVISVIETNKASFAVPPGGQRVLTLRFTAFAVGESTGTLAIVSDDPSQARADVALRGNGQVQGGVVLVPRIVVTPAELNYNDVLVGEEAHQTVMLLNDGDAVLSVALSVNGDPAFSPGGSSTGFSLPPGGLEMVLVRFGPKSMGRQTGQLSIMSNDPLRPLVTVSLTGTGVRPVLEVMPKTLDFGKVGYGEGIERACTLKNNGNTSLTIAAAFCSAVEFTVVSDPLPVDLQPGEEANLTVRFKPRYAGVQPGRLSILSSDPENPKAQVDLEGTGFFPAIEVVPRVLDFGSVPVGASKELPITVRNLGPAPLVIESVSTSVEDFMVASPAVPFTVPAESALSVQIRFTACSAGLQSGTFFFHSNDPDTPSVSVDATGNSTAASEPTVVITGSGKGRKVVQEPMGGWQTNDFNLDVSLTFKPRSVEKQGDIWRSTVADVTGRIRFWGVASDYWENMEWVEDYDGSVSYDLSGHEAYLDFSPTDAALLYAGLALPESLDNSRPRFYGFKYLSDRKRAQVYVHMPVHFGGWWFDDIYEVPGKACVSGFESSLTVNVVDAETRLPLSDANVFLGPYSRLTDADGVSYFASISAGNYALAVKKEGYNSWKSTVSLPPFGSPPPLMVSLNRLGEISVNRLESKYVGFRYYLDTISFPVTFNAEVNWGGHQPGKIQFVTPRKTVEVETACSDAFCTLDMGRDFGPGGVLRAIAVSADGTRSPDREADLVVMPAIFGATLLKVTDPVPGDFYYKCAAGLNWELLNDLFPPESIRADMLLFGNRPFGLRAVPTVEIEVKGSQAEYTLVLEGYDLSTVKVAGRDLDIHLFGRVTGNYIRTENCWQWDGGIGAKGNLSFRSPPVMWGPFYVRPLFEPEGEVFLHSFRSYPAGAIPVPPSLFLPTAVDGKLGVGVGGDLGVGLAELLAEEAWFKGGVTIELAALPKPGVDDAYFFIEGGVRVYAFLFKYEQVIGRKEWHLNKKQTPAAPDLDAPDRQPTLELLGRDYLQSPNYGAFVGTKSLLAIQRLSASPRSATGVQPLQLSAFPYSNPSSVEVDGGLGLVWVHDSPERTAENRTVVVSSLFDSTGWTDPTPIADDGTADFHPKLAAFKDGSLVAAWEDENKLFGPGVLPQDMAASLEISAAWYDLKAGKWQPADRLTSNGHLDRSPKLSGQGGHDALVVWLANEANDILGCVQRPNRLLCSWWKDGTWGQPQEIAMLPYPTLRYDVAYDGATAEVVLSLDTDQNTDTVDDHELFRCTWANGRWESLERLTTDSLPDDNPILARDSHGNLLLLWFKGDGISSAVNFNLANRQLIFADTYSSHLADFKLAKSLDGRLALVWAEPSENASDLWGVFYDPAFGLWSKPKQLTSDEETERWLTTSFLGTNVLIAVYDRTLPTTSLAQTNAKTDLCVFQYSLSRDLTLKRDSFRILPNNPSPGESAQLRVTAANVGAMPVESPPVAFFLGNPAQGGVEIGRTNIGQVLTCGESVEVTCHLLVPYTTKPLIVYAVADPEQRIPDADPSNNILVLEFTQADLAIESVTWSQTGSNQVWIMARLINQGAIASDAFTVAFRKTSETGDVLYSQNVPSLAKGDMVEVKFVWDVAHLDQDLQVHALIENGNSTNEFDPENNRARLTIQRASPATRWELGVPLWLPDGVFQLAVAGPVGQSFTIETSTDLVTWSPWRTFVTTNSVTSLLDTNTAGISHRFYRAKAP